MQSVEDRSAFHTNGFLIAIILCATAVVVFKVSPFVFPIYLMSATALSTGFTVIQPNEARVLTFFGKYVGTIKESGFQFTIPFTEKRRVALKLDNFVTDILKVNDLNGNPVEIGAVVVWRVADAAQASLNIDDYRTFIAKQSDTAIRAMAARYPYDSDKAHSLRGNVDEIAAGLQVILQEKLSVAGIVVEEIRLSHLAYAPEIAGAMLKRQQAVAMFEARQYMVQNALAMIDEVMSHFENKGNVVFSNDKKADLINSLLIVMTSDKESSPVLNLVK